MISMTRWQKLRLLVWSVLAGLGSAPDERPTGERGDLLVRWGEGYHRPMPQQDVTRMRGLMRLSPGCYRLNLDTPPRQDGRPWVAMAPGFAGGAEMHEEGGRAWIMITLRTASGEPADVSFIMGVC